MKQPDTLPPPPPELPTTGPCYFCADSRGARKDGILQCAQCIERFKRK